MAGELRPPASCGRDDFRELLTTQETSSPTPLAGGALSYLTELYATTGDDEATQAAYASLCETCGEGHVATLYHYDRLGSCAAGPEECADSTSW